MPELRREPEQIKNHQLEELIRLTKELVELGNLQVQYLRVIAKDTAPQVLKRIKIQFSKGTSMPIGPVTLTTAGQQVTASVVGFDQFGQPYTGTMPPATLSSDDTAQAIVTFDPTTGLTTAVANGVANITGSLTTAEGLALTDTESVTVAIPIVPPPTPVLSSIKISFA